MMKKLNWLILICSLVFICGPVKAQDNSIQAASNVRGAQYPRILPDGRAIFRLKAPEARLVQLDLAGKQYEYMKNNGALVNNNLKQFWISMGGKEDIAWQNCQTMMAKLDEMKIRYAYSEYPGSHAWPVWRNNLYNFAQLLFK